MKMSEIIRNDFPLPESVANELFDFIAAQLGPDIEGGCEKSSGHDFRFTREFIGSHGLDEDEIMSWLEDFQDEAGCDCQVLVLVAIWYAPQGYEPGSRSLHGSGCFSEPCPGR